MDYMHHCLKCFAMIEVYFAIQIKYKCYYKIVKYQLVLNTCTYSLFAIRSQKPKKDTADSNRIWILNTSTWHQIFLMCPMVTLVTTPLPLLINFQKLKDKSTKYYNNASCTYFRHICKDYNVVIFISPNWVKTTHFYCMCT